MDSEEQLSVTTYFRHYQEYCNQEDIYKVGLKIDYNKIRIKKGDE